MAFGRRKVPPPQPAQPAAPEEQNPSIVPAQSQEQVVTSKRPEVDRATMERIGEAGREIAEMLMAHYRDTAGRINAETALGAAAALAGEFALRSTGMPIPDQPTWIANGPQDQILFGESEQDATAATVWSLIAKAARDKGVPPDRLPVPTHILTHTLANFGASPFPPLTVPVEYFPKEWSPNAGPRLRHKIGAVGIKFDLSARDVVMALGMAIGILIGVTAHVLPPEIAARLAAEIMIGTAHMAPLSEPMATD